MPAGTPTPASDTQAGGHKPRPTSEERAAAAFRFRTSSIAAEILRILPEHGAPPIGVAEATAIIGIGARNTVRHLMRDAVILGFATAEEVETKNGLYKKLYNRAPALAPDDFELSPEMYGSDEQ